MQYGALRSTLEFPRHVGLVGAMTYVRALEMELTEAY